MNKLLIFLTLFAVLVLSSGARAQTKKRIAFKNKYAEVTATIKDAETLQYVFRAPKNADVEIWIDHSDAANVAYPKFWLYKPNGKLFYDTDSVNYGGLSDLMDILPQAGDYTLRLQLPGDARDRDKPVKFTLRIVLK